MIIVIKEDGTVLPVGKLNFAPTMKLKQPVFLEDHIVEVSGELLSTNASVTKTATQGTKYKTKPGATVTDYVATASKPTTKYPDKTVTATRETSPWRSSTKHVTKGTKFHSKTVTNVSYAGTTTKEQEKTFTKYVTGFENTVTNTKATYASVWATATVYATDYHTVTRTNTNYHTTDKVTATSHPYEATTTKEASFTNTKYYSRTTTKVVSVASSVGDACIECSENGYDTPAYFDTDISGVTGCTEVNGQRRCDQEATASCEFYKENADGSKHLVTIWSPSEVLVEAGFNLSGVEEVEYWSDSLSPNACEYTGTVPYAGSYGTCDGSSSTCSITSSIA